MPVFSRFLLAALRTLSVCLLSIGLLRSFCCGFAGNTWPHWLSESTTWCGLNVCRLQPGWVGHNHVHVSFADSAVAFTLEIPAALLGHLGQ